MGIKELLGLGEAVSKPIAAISDLYTTDKARIAAETQYQEVVQKPQLAEIENNEIESSSGSWFNSGWRPLCGYVCTASLAWTYLLQPMLIFVLTVLHGHIPTLQNDATGVMPIITGMLGLGILKSVENIKKK